MTTALFRITAFFPTSAAWRLPALALALLVLALLGACQGERVAAQAPSRPLLDIPADARGHYCGMYLSEHAGPKGQVRVRDLAAPLWFTSVREVFSFLEAPDEPKAVTGVYVQDMGRRQADGGFPADAWIDARSAWYVIGAGMPDLSAADDALPFASREAAQSHRARHGGQVVAFDAMPESFVRMGSDALTQGGAS